MILYEAIAQKIHSKNETKKRAFINDKVAELSQARDKGQRLASNLPEAAVYNPQVIVSWIQDVHKWTDEINEGVSRHSDFASRTFMLIDKTQDIDGMISSHGRNFLVHAQAYETYKEFVSRLENLRRILDRPEAYF